MEMIEKILYPVSLTEASPRIVPYVSLMAKQFAAEIHLLYVAQEPERFMGIHVKASIVEDFTNELVKGAKEQLSLFKEKYFQDFPSTKTSVLSGDRSEQILSYIQAERIDLVIMGAQTRALDKILFGSVAEKVIKQAPVPVLVVKPFEKKSDT